MKIPLQEQECPHCIKMGPGCIYSHRVQCGQGHKLRFLLFWTNCLLKRTTQTHMSLLFSRAFWPFSRDVKLWIYLWKTLACFSRQVALSKFKQDGELWISAPQISIRSLAPQSMICSVLCLHTMITSALQTASVHAKKKTNHEWRIKCAAWLSTQVSFWSNSFSPPKIAWNGLMCLNKNNKAKLTTADKDPYPQPLHSKMQMIENFACRVGPETGNNQKITLEKRNDSVRQMREGKIRVNRRKLAKSKDMHNASHLVDHKEEVESHFRETLPKRDPMLSCVFLTQCSFKYVNIIPVRGARRWKNHLLTVKLSFLWGSWKFIENFESWLGMETALEKVSSHASAACECSFRRKTETAKCSFLILCGLAQYPRRDLKQKKHTRLKCLSVVNSPVHFAFQRAHFHCTETLG